MLRSLLLSLLFFLPMANLYAQSPESDFLHVRMIPDLPAPHFSNHYNAEPDPDPERILHHLHTDTLLQRTHDDEDTSPTFLLGRTALERYNPVSVVLSGALLTYQQLISPQLSNRCIYTPSCSSFSREVMQNKGLLHGILLSADRISRCNRVAASDSPHHRIDPESRRIRDESERYFN